MSLIGARGFPEILSKYCSCCSKLSGISSLVSNQLNSCQLFTYLVFGKFWFSKWNNFSHYAAEIHVVTMEFGFSDTVKTNKRWVFPDFFCYAISHRLKKSLMRMLIFCQWILLQKNVFSKGTYKWKSKNYKNIHKCCIFFPENFLLILWHFALWNLVYLVRYFQFPLHLLLNLFSYILGEERKPKFVC